MSQRHVQSHELVKVWLCYGALVNEKQWFQSIFASVKEDSILAFGVDVFWSTRDDHRYNVMWECCKFESEFEQKCFNSTVWWMRIPREKAQLLGMSLLQHLEFSALAQTSTEVAFCSSSLNDKTNSPRKKKLSSEECHCYNIWSFQHSRKLLQKLLFIQAVSATAETSFMLFCILNIRLINVLVVSDIRH